MQNVDYEKTRTDGGNIPVQQVDLATYNILMRHLSAEKKKAREVQLKAMSYDKAIQYHRSKGRIGK